MIATTKKAWFGSVLMLTGCAAAPDTRVADEAALRQADIAWVKAAQTTKVEAWTAFYSDDAVVLPANDKVASNKGAIAKAVGDLLTLPGIKIRWEPSKIEVAKSGDLAYIWGTYNLTFNDPAGKPVNDKGKIVEIWKKQPDGAWKCIVDTWNTDTPPAPLPAAPAKL